VGTTPSRLEWSPTRLLSSVRFDEVVVLQGAPLAGAMFSIGSLGPHSVLVLAALLTGSLALVAHVFVLNDWSGIHGDLRDPARAGRTFVQKGVSRTELGYLAIALLALALSLFGLVGVATLAIGLLIAGASALYSMPAFHLKGIPVASSALHLVGGILHFLLGYTAFAAVDERGVLIGSFFALVFTAGHLTHEARGYEGDSLNGIRTNAVAFGKTRSFVAGLALFTAAYGVLAALAAHGIVPRVLLLAAVLYPVHLWMSLRALRTGLTLRSLSRLQACYRALFAIIGVAMVMALYPR
jgi:4-hydroxybenzoate polyprenyltransferase